MNKINFDVTRKELENDQIKLFNKLAKILFASGLICVSMAVGGILALNEISFPPEALIPQSVAVPLYMTPVIMTIAIYFEVKKESLKKKMPQ